MGSSGHGILRCYCRQATSAGTFFCAHQICKSIDLQRNCMLSRTACSLHLVAVYTFYVGGLPGFGAALQPAAGQKLLEALGLFQPSVAAGMVPLLGLLLLVRLACGPDMHCMQLLPIVAVADVPCAPRCCRRRCTEV